MRRLEKVFENLGESARGTVCPAIDGIISEGNEVAGEVDNKQVLDAAVIGSAQAIDWRGQVMLLTSGSRSLKTR